MTSATAQVVRQTAATLNQTDATTAELQQTVYHCPSFVFMLIFNF